MIRPNIVYASNASHLGAVVGSIALHALLAAAIFTAAAPVEMVMQQMIKVTLVAAYAPEIIKKPEKSKPAISQQVTKPEPEKPRISEQKPKKSARVAPLPPAPRTLQTPEQLAALSPASGNTSAARTTAQLATTAPLFDAAYLNNPAPVYPAQAKRRGMEGSVLLGVVVWPDGTARSVTVEKSSGFAMLDASAREAVARWKFIPARRGDHTVEARVIVPIDFRLESRI